MFWDIKDDRLINYSREINNAVHIQTYRSRRELDVYDIRNIFIPYFLYGDITSNLEFTFKTSAIDKSLSAEQKTEEILYKGTLSSDQMYRNIGIVYIQNNADGIKDVVDRLVAGYGYKELEYRSALIMSPYHVVYTLYKESSRELIVLTNTLDIQLVLKLGAILPLVFEYNTHENFTKAFLELNERLFTETFKELYTDMLEAKRKRDIEKALTLCSTAILTQNTATLDNSIQRLTQMIQQQLNVLKENYEKLKELKIKKASTFWKEQEEKLQGFVEYLRAYHMDNIIQLRFSHNKYLAVLYSTQLLFWDEEQYALYANSTTRNAITQLNPTQRKICDEIFLERNLIINFCTSFSFNLVSGDVERNSAFSAEALTPYGFQNTHIHGFNCWGDNFPLIRRAVAEHEDYIVAWEQIKATLSGINLADSTVFNRFISNLFASGYGDDLTMTLKETGELVSVNEMLERYA